MLVTIVLAIVFIVPMTFDPDELPLNYAKVDSKLYLGKGKNQPLLVYFGGSEGGNSMTKPHKVKHREQYTNQGYAMLAIGYFGMVGTPEEVDRISLNAIHDEIVEAMNNPSIDSNCVAVMGGSKGAELALTLASKYSDIKGAVAFAGSHVVFASPSIYTDGMASSFMLNDKQLPSVPLTPEIIPTLILEGFREAHEVALEDTLAVDKARIEVEEINGPILLISGEKDHIWPSKEMSDEVINRLKSKGFSYPVQHIVVPNGNHFQPQSDYHPQTIEFLNMNLLPACERNQSKISYKPFKRALCFKEVYGYR